jgi:hypothetical protein
MDTAWSQPIEWYRRLGHPGGPSPPVPPSPPDRPLDLLGDQLHGARPRDELQHPQFAVVTDQRSV